MYTRDELIKALSEILDNNKSEEEQNQVFQRINQKVLDPQWSDHLFHSNKFYDGEGNVDLKALASKILAYQPIQM